jgi:DNA-binding MarR family transcriptional regulator
MNQSKPDVLSPNDQEMKEILQRLFHIRRRFKLAIPEVVSIFKARILETKDEDKFEGADDVDHFYSVGAILSRQKEPMTMGDLSRALDVTLSNATRLVDWMVRNEYARRLTDTEDRRIVRVELTPSGQEVYQTINDIFMLRARGLMQFFTPKEQEDLIYLMRKLVSVMEKEP